MTIEAERLAESTLHALRAVDTAGGSEVDRLACLRDAFDAVLAKDIVRQAAQLVHDSFVSDEAVGFRTDDRLFVIETLGRALSGQAPK
jgi:hypothetical protein